MQGEHKIALFLTEHGGGGGDSVGQEQWQRELKTMIELSKKRRVNLESGRQGIREGFFNDMTSFLKFSGWEACKRL